MQGSCLCGGIKFEIKVFIPHTTNCHCSMCRKFHGAAFASYGVVHINDFKYLSGKYLLKTYEAKNKTVRSFCQHCGASLFFQEKDNNQTIDVALGAMDSVPNVIPEGHIYTSNQAPWFEIKDNLPTFKKGHNLV